MSKQGMVVKGMMDYESVVNFLEDFLKSFKEKTVCVQRGDDFVTLKPADNMDVEIEASVKKGKQKVSIELEWREEIQRESDVAFKVSAVEPEPKPEPEPEDKAETEPEAGAEQEAASGADADKKQSEVMEEKKEEKCEAPSPKSIEVAKGTPSILAPTPTSKPVVEPKAEDKPETADAAKGTAKSAAKSKSSGAKKTTSGNK